MSGYTRRCWTLHSAGAAHFCIALTNSKAANLPKNVNADRCMTLTGSSPGLVRLSRSFLQARYCPARLRPKCNRRKLVVRRSAASNLRREYHLVQPSEMSKPRGRGRGSDRRPELKRPGLRPVSEDSRIFITDQLKAFQQGTAQGSLEDLISTHSAMTDLNTAMHQLPKLTMCPPSCRVDLSS